MAIDRKYSYSGVGCNLRAEGAKVLRSIAKPQLPMFLRRPATRWRVVLALSFALVIAGIAQASHFHKSAPGHNQGTDAQCLLCLHAATGSGPPPSLTSANFSPARTAPVTAVATLVAGVAIVVYHARGPPES